MRCAILKFFAFISAVLFPEFSDTCCVVCYAACRALKHGGKFPLVLPTWDWHRGLLKLPPPLLGGRRAIEERKMLEAAKK